MSKWAKGGRALSCCQRCGWCEKYSTMKKELSGLIVCSTCYDGDYQLLNHPANFPAPFRPDAPLKNPRPDVRPDEPEQLPYGTWEYTPATGLSYEDDVIITFEDDEALGI